MNEYDFEDLNDDLSSRNFELAQENKILRQKLAQLKELLKEIRDNIAGSQLKLTSEGFKLITKTVAKIDEVLR